MLLKIIYNHSIFVIPAWKDYKLFLCFVLELIIYTWKPNCLIYWHLHCSLFWENNIYNSYRFWISKYNGTQIKVWLLPWKVLIVIISLMKTEAVTWPYDLRRISQLEVLILSIIINIKRFSLVYNIQVITLRLSHYTRRVSK